MRDRVYCLVSMMMQVFSVTCKTKEDGEERKDCKKIHTFCEYTSNLVIVIYVQGSKNIIDLHLPLPCLDNHYGTAFEIKLNKLNSAAGAKSNAFMSSIKNGTCFLQMFKGKFYKHFVLLQ